ncbi:MAG TPA: hypothetical protein VNG33_12955, partial [Polyangiaceae bacterium]|nr:hypothetical protein [Polyangiaceae bacterium]
VPLNEAVSRGIVQTPGSALVALSASLAEVDLGSGELKQQGPQLLPGSPDCELLRQGSELLMACLPQSALVILSVAAHKPSSIERRFNGHPALRVSAGQLLVEASCGGDPTPGSVCVRAAGGDWKQLSLHSEAPSVPGGAGAGGGPAAAAKPPRPFAYVPRAEGGAVALVREPVHGYLDLASGRATPLSGDFEDVARSPEHCLIDGSGLRCLTVNGPVAFDRDGKQEPRVFRFNWTTATGLRGLGRDSDGRLFQTEDLGRTWVEVAAPPAWGDPGGNQDRCSEAGCRLWGWLRTGWERRSPRTAEPPELIAIGEAPTPTRPLLACRALQIPALTRASPPATPGAPVVGEDASPFVFGFGSELLSSQKFELPIETPTPSQAPGGAGDVATRGMLSSHTTQHPDPKHPDVVITDSEPFRLRYVQHFEPTARPQLASVTFAELVRAARRLAAAEPSPELEGTGSLLTTPVLGREPGKSAGFLTLLDTARIWVNGSQVVALTPTPGTWIASGAAVDRDGSLLVLFVADDLATRLWRFRQGAGVELFAVPAPSARTSYTTSDALGVSARGELAVLRFPSGEQPPSEADPALAYMPGKPLEQLAPWSQLLPIGDPGCADKSGYRAIVAAPQGWLSLRDGDEVTDGWGTIAAVRWSHERVCLEALKTADNDYEHADESTE